MRLSVAWLAGALSIPIEKTPGTSAAASKAFSQPPREESSQASQAIAREIATVDGCICEMAAGSDQVRESAGQLATLADGLRETVGRFQTGV